MNGAGGSIGPGFAGERQHAQKNREGRQNESDGVHPSPSESGAHSVFYCDYRGLPLLDSPSPLAADRLPLTHDRIYALAGHAGHVAADMERFRRIELTFRDVCLGWGYEEVRTPRSSTCISSPPHGTSLRIVGPRYSFLDWDG